MWPVLNSQTLFVSVGTLMRFRIKFTISRRDGTTLTSILLFACKSHHTSIAFVRRSPNIHSDPIWMRVKYWWPYYEIWTVRFLFSQPHHLTSTSKNIRREWTETEKCIREWLIAMLGDAMRDERTMREIKKHYLFCFIMNDSFFSSSKSTRRKWKHKLFYERLRIAQHNTGDRKFKLLRWNRHHSLHKFKCCVFHQLKIMDLIKLLLRQLILN